MAVDRKRGDRAVPRSAYEIVRSALLDPDIALDIAPIDPAVWRHFETLPRVIADPMDGLIVATALALNAPLVTADGVITKADVVDVIW